MMTLRSVRRSLILLALPLVAVAQGAPTVDDLLALKSVSGTAISPDGKWVAYGVTTTDLAQDAFVTQLWLVNVASGDAHQLTRGDKGAGQPRWSPDGAWLAFTSTRVGDRSQIFLIRPNGGEAVQLTRAETAVNGFAWARDGKQIAFTAAEPAPPKETKARRDSLGDFEVVRHEYQHVHLWMIDVAAAIVALQPGTQLTKGKRFSVGSFSWSPDGARLAFDATATPDLIHGATADIWVLTLADTSVRLVVSQPGADNGPIWSPDGTQIAFTSAMRHERAFARNSRIAVVAAAGGTPRAVSDAFDENPTLIEWRTDGIWFGGSQKTASHLFRVSSQGGAVTRLSGPDAFMGGAWSIARDGGAVAFAVSSPGALVEVAVSQLTSFAPRTLTHMTNQLRGLAIGTREVISWKSRDGATIEGVLIKPADFDPSRTYPLLCVLHGGPTGTDRPALPDARYYPIDVWVARGALVLKVNYRGSAGYGETFRRLNERNLGVGDAWDVLSGVDELIRRGWVDPAKVASMGWSQGGYISAFLTTSTTRFAAISVGAGISDWATYYYNTDITPFTINYLGADPVADPEIYRLTSPISYVKGAKTPTLIQHGELDRRVPIANAYELRQALEDRGVPVEMVVYKGFGHGITRPRAMRAVMFHNLAWFNHWLWGDPLPDLTRPSGGP